jgi:hypothetical protein
VNFNVLMAVKVLKFVFCVVTPQTLADRYQRFGEKNCLNISHEDGGSIFSETLVSTYKSTRRYDS